MNEPDTPTALSGRCMCGAVRFELAEPPLGAAYCHCKRCQRRTGTQFSVSALTATGSFALTQGEAHVRTWRPGDDGWSKSFCSLCGSQLYTAHPEDPELIAVRMGALDGDPGIQPTAHQFVDYAAPWAPMPEDRHPRFRERLGSARER